MIPELDLGKLTGNSNWGYKMIHPNGSEAPQWSEIHVWMMVWSHKNADIRWAIKELDSCFEKLKLYNLQGERIDVLLFFFLWLIDLINMENGTFFAFYF